ncbi:HD domain-containing protein [bacterium]|nr:HD domain-containing protein [bacterium]
MKAIYIQDIEPGLVFTSCFALRKVELRDSGGKQYLVLELGDRTGRLRATYWGSNSSRLARSLSLYDLVEIEGQGTVFRDELEIKIDNIRQVAAGEYDNTDFIPTSATPPQKLMDEYRKWVKSIENEYLFGIFRELFRSKDFKGRFMLAPGGKLWHHAYLGGLLEHTMSVAGICQKAAELYPGVNRDLLITGALLHDVGKAYEMVWTTFIDYSVRGRLEGHISIGAQMVREAITHIKDFPEDLANKVIHLILAHQGEKQYGSPVVPMMMEAVILYFADQLDSQASAFSRIIESERDGKKVWSDWVHLIDRFIYLK